MNFLFFATSNFKPETGGIAELGHQLAAALTEKGHSVTVLAHTHPESKDEQYSYSVIRTEQIQPVKLAEELIRAKKPDVLFVLVLGSSWLTARRLGSRYKIPVVLYVHGLEISKKNNSYPVFWAKQFVKGLMVRKSNLVLCNSRNTRKLAIARGASPERTRILYPGINPVNTKIKDYHDPAPGRFVFFTMGRLVKRKGVDNAIRAVSMLTEAFPNLLYVIAGAGKEDYLRELESLRDSLGLEKHVLFLGRIDDEARDIWYRREDVFIMASRRLSDGDVEGFGIVFLEAGIWEKPVIGGNSGGVSDAVEDGKSGCLVDPDSPEAIASAMRFFMENPEEGQKMGVFGRRRALEQFSWDHQADVFLDIIKP